MAENRCFMLTLQTLLRKSNCRTKRYENNNVSLFGLSIWVLWNWHILFIYMNNMNVLLFTCFCNNSWISWILHYKLSLNIFWIWYYLWSTSRQPTVPVIRLSKIFSTVHYTFSSHKYIATIKIWCIGLWVYNENTKRCELD